MRIHCSFLRRHRFWKQELKGYGNGFFLGCFQQKYMNNVFLHLVLYVYILAILENVSWPCTWQLVSFLGTLDEGRRTGILLLRGQSLETVPSEIASLKGSLTVRLLAHARVWMWMTEIALSSVDRFFLQSLERAVGRYSNPQYSSLSRSPRKWYLRAPGQTTVSVPSAFATEWQRFLKSAAVYSGTARPWGARSFSLSSIRFAVRHISDVVAYYIESDRQSSRSAAEWTGYDTNHQSM